MPPTRSIHRGRLEYRGDTGLRGAETWELTCSADGSKTLQAHCRMFDTDVERWVVHTVDPEMRPTRSFVSHRVGDRFLGEGWFRFRPGRLVGHADLAGLGEVSQRITIDGSADYFVPHAVAADAWITPCYDHAVAGWQDIAHGYASSLRADGTTGPLIEHHRQIRQRLVGEETIDVPAGTYRTYHFVVSAGPGIEEHLWVSTDESSMLVKLRSDRLATTYLLVEHHRWPGSGNQADQSVDPDHPSAIYSA